MCREQRRLCQRQPRAFVGAHRDGRVFDPDTIPSDMGLISETFRRRSGVHRSRHPYHPVAALGPRAGEMLRDHERSNVPDGPETPYGRLISEIDGDLLSIERERLRP